MERVTIIGLGLIGGSLGLALKRAKGANVEIVGYTRTPHSAAKALQRGAVDRTVDSLAFAVAESQLVIIATPVMTIKEILSHIARVLPNNCVVTDVGSTKRLVMRWAEEYLPSTVSFIGGHPMAGKETSGIDSADANLFNGCTYCLIPAPAATDDAVHSVSEMVELIGAKALFIDAADHDRFVAGISHLPLLLSAALISVTANSPSWGEMSRLAATGFGDVSRLASGDPIMSHDICLTNRETIVSWLDSYIDQLKEYQRLVTEGGEELREAFLQAKKARDRWLRGGGS